MRREGGIGQREGAGRGEGSARGKRWVEDEEGGALASHESTTKLLAAGSDLSKPSRTRTGFPSFTGDDNERNVAQMLDALRTRGTYREIRDTLDGSECDECDACDECDECDECD